MADFHKAATFGLPKIVGYNRDCLVFDNGNQISFLLPSTYIAGRSLTHVVADNADAISFAEEENFYSTLVLANTGQTVVAGVPKADVGIFYSLTDNSVMFTNVREVPYHLNPQYDREWEVERRQQLGDDVFENQYNCQFIKTKF